MVVTHIRQAHRATFLLYFDIRGDYCLEDELSWPADYMGKRCENLNQRSGQFRFIQTNRLDPMKRPHGLQLETKINVFIVTLKGVLVFRVFLFYAVLQLIIWQVTFCYFSFHFSYLNQWCCGVVSKSRAYPYKVNCVKHWAPLASVRS